jgi:hypothetical protein
MLSNREEKFLADYRTQLEKPKWKFVLLYGFTWAVLVFLATTTFALHQGEQLAFRKALISLAVYLLGGLFYGAFFRWQLSRRIKKLESKRSAA